MGVGVFVRMLYQMIFLPHIQISSAYSVEDHDLAGYK